MDVMTRTLAFALVLFLPAAAHAQSAFTGKWAGQTPSGSSVELTFSITDNAATATLRVNGEPVVVTDVKVTDKDKRLTFIGTRGTSDPRSMACELNAEELRCWPENQGPSAAAVLKRATSAAAGAAAAGLAGKWNGVTPSGRALTVELEVNGAKLTGRLTLANQTANAIDGTVDGTTFAFTAGTIDGRPVVAKGKLVGEEIEFNVEGVSETLKLKRAK